jgi:antitoxin component of RelBE/YafQ-DinJ toxin-antitoxin module
MENLSKQVNFKANAEVLAEAKKVFKSKNMTLTAALNSFLETVSVTKEVPIEKQDDLERRRLIAAFQKEVQQNIQDIRDGKGLTVEEARARLRL